MAESPPSPLTGRSPGQSCTRRASRTPLSHRQRRVPASVTSATRKRAPSSCSTVTCSTVVPPAPGVLEFDREPRLEGLDHDLAGLEVVVELGVVEIELDAIEDLLARVVSRLRRGARRVEPGHEPAVRERARARSRAGSGATNARSVVGCWGAQTSGRTPGPGLRPARSRLCVGRRSPLPGRPRGPRADAAQGARR